MKVLIVGEGCYPFVKSGYSRYNTQIADALQKQQHDVFWLTFTDLMKLTHNGIHLIAPPYDKSMLEKAVEHWTNELDIDVVIITGDWFILAAFTNIATKAQLYGMLWVDGTPLPDGAKYALVNYDRIFTASKYGCLVLQDSGFNAEYAPPCVNTQVFRPIDDITPNYIGSVSRFLRRKGYESLLVAFSKLPQTEKLYLHLSPEDPAAPFNLEKAIHMLNIHKRVSLPNTLNIPDTKLAEIYNMMKCHVLLSHGEGFGITILESQACGIPNVVVNHASQAELVCDTGFQVNVADLYKNDQNVTWARADTNHACSQIVEAIEQREKLKQKCVKFAKQFEHNFWENIKL